MNKKSEANRKKEDYRYNPFTLYPVIYKEKEWYEKDCDSVFSAYYSCKEALNFECGVYVSEGIWVFPDGRMEKW
jgi:hypothetical protein